MGVREKGGCFGGGAVNERELCWGRGQVGRENLSDSIREGEGIMVGAERELGSGRSGSVACDVGGQ